MDKQSSLYIYISLSTSTEQHGAVQVSMWVLSYEYGVSHELPFHRSRPSYNKTIKIKPKKLNYLVNGKTANFLRNLGTLPSQSLCRKNNLMVKFPKTTRKKC